MIFGWDNMIFDWVAFGTAIFEEIEVIKGICACFDRDKAYQQEQ